MRARLAFGLRCSALFSAFFASTALAIAEPRGIVDAVSAPGGVGHSLLVGPSAELYRAIEPGIWGRVDRGGFAGEVQRVLHVGGELHAAATRAPLYRLTAASTWSVLPLAKRGGAVVGGLGGEPAVALGRQLYVGESGRWARAIAAPAQLTALWASRGQRLYAATSDGAVWRSEGRRWRAIGGRFVAGEHGVAFAGIPGSMLVVLTSKGRLLRVGDEHEALNASAPAGFVPQVLGVGEGRVWAAGPTASGTHHLMSVVEGVLLDDGALPMAADEPITVLLIEDGEVLIAGARGSVWTRDRTAIWHPGQLRQAPPRAPPPGAGPARSR